MTVKKINYKFIKILLIITICLFCIFFLSIRLNNNRFHNKLNQ